MNEKQPSFAAKTMDRENLSAGNVDGEVLHFNLPHASIFYAIEAIVALIIVFYFGSKT